MDRRCGFRDFFGTVDHEKLLTLVGKQIADSRVLKLIQQMLEAGYEERGQKFATPRGTPQGGVCLTTAEQYPARLPLTRR